MSFISSVFVIHHDAQCIIASIRDEESINDAYWPILALDQGLKIWYLSNRESVVDFSLSCIGVFNRKQPFAVFVYAFAERKRDDTSRVEEGGFPDDLRRQLRNVECGSFEHSGDGKPERKMFVVAVPGVNSTKPVHANGLVEPLLAFVSVNVVVRSFTLYRLKNREQRVWSSS